MPGCCSCAAAVLELTTHSESSIQSSPPVSPRTTTHLSDLASAVCWGCLRPTSSGIWPACLCLWAAWASEAPQCSQTRSLVKLGTLPGDGAHALWTPCMFNTLLSTWRGPRLWGTSGSGWIPRTFMAGGRGSSPCGNAEPTCPRPVRGGQHQTKTLSNRAGLV